ncbi:MAG: trigger factor [Oscillospiraceae bacterium]|nr:trigger factor [Oscillospiraceae bacterium]
MSFQYRGLKGEYEKHVVTDMEIDHRLKMLAQQNPRIIPVNDRPSQNGDEVVLDYAGFCDGVQFPGGTAEMQTLVLGSHTFIPGFEEQLLNHMPGDEVSVKVMFPSEYHAPELAGKAAEFKCKIHQIREKTEYQMDDVFAMEMGGVATFAEMREQYAKAFQEYADNQSEMELQDNLLRAAAKTLEFTPTEEQIETELDAHLETLKAQLADKGLNLEMYCQFMKTDVEKLRKDARENAIMSLRVQATIAEVVKLEKLEVTEEEMEAALEVICRQNNMSIEMLKPHIDAEFTAAVTRSVLMGKVMRLIRDAAEVTDAE